LEAHVTDVYVAERTDAEISEIALAARDLFGFGNQSCPDLIQALENELPKYLPQFALLPVPDGSLGYNKVARASYNPHKIEIVNSGYKRLCECDPEARFDVAHELGHFFLHYDGTHSLPKYRSIGNVSYIKRPAMSGEVQADKFGREFLLPGHVAVQFGSWEEMTNWCKVPARIAQEAFRIHGQRTIRAIPDQLKDLLNELGR
jgi:Zn-dependent peptidase ImmA (M78 family)